MKMPPSSEKQRLIDREIGRDVSWTGEERDYYQTGHTIMLNIKYRNLALATTLMAVTSFIFCLLYSYVFHFEEVTSTHCNVWNGAPSVSASIGSNAPQRYIWTLVMALHTGPKLLLCAMYHSVNTARDQDKLLANFNSFLFFLELISLLMVSVVPSIELYNLHIIATGVFLVSSALHMSLSFYLTRSVARRAKNSFERKIFTLQE